MTLKYLWKANTKSTRSIGFRLTALCLTKRSSATDLNDNVGTATRKVNIIDYSDAVAPVITLIGSSTVSLEIGSEYIDQGATSDTGEEVIIDSSNVKEDVIGSYIVNYTATDFNNNVGTATRTVNVIEAESDFIVDVNTGWNMIGTSFASTISDNDSSNPVLISNSMYWFNGSSYESPEISFTAEPNKGYWIKCSNSGKIKLTRSGNLNTTSVSINVSQGWNMIGSSFTANIENSSIIINNSLYWFNGSSYGNAIEPKVLEGSKGYWIKCSSSGSIVLNF